MKTMRWSAVIVIAAGLAVGGGMTPARAQMVGPAVMPRAQIYPGVDAAQQDIRSALAEARRTHRRVLLDFGGDWCGDCQMLNYWFHQAPNAALLAKYYVLVDVNVGHIDQNIDIGTKYGVPLKKGVPALAVLRPDGGVVYAQQGEFEDFRHNNPADLTAFLEKWKGKS
jgi:thiol:disulfide interchange protein